MKIQYDFTIFQKMKILNFFLELGWTQPNHFGMGRCYRPIKQWISPLFTYNVNSGEDDVEEEEGGGRGGGS
jgi:hypothetical protein